MTKCKYWDTNLITGEGHCMKCSSFPNVQVPRMESRSIEYLTQVYYEDNFIKVNVNGKVLAEFDCCSFFDFFIKNFPEPKESNTGQNLGIARRKLQCEFARNNGAFISDILTK